MVINLEKEETRNKFVEFIKDENQSEIAMNGLNANTKIISFYIANMNIKAQNK